jgi:hypothetical protein
MSSFDNSGFPFMNVLMSASETLLSSYFTIGESIGMEKMEYIELCVESVYVKRWEGLSYREPPTAIVKAPEPGPQGLRPNFRLRI